MRPHTEDYLAIAPRAGSIPALDGLRGIAILLVLLRHVTRPIYDETGSFVLLGPWDLGAPLMNGWMGVDLFFVLSGFLVTHHLLNRWPERWSFTFLGRYWGKRILRTFPTYYAVLLVVASGVLPFYRPEVPWPEREFLMHLFFLQDYTGSNYMAAFWSLGVEEKFYLTCPLVLAMLGAFPRTRQISILVALALLPIGFRAIALASHAPGLTDYDHFFWGVRSPAHQAMDGLWMGVICALILRWRPTWFDAPERPRQLLYAGLTLLALVMLPAAWFDQQWRWTAVFLISAIALAFALLVLASVLGEHPLSRMLAARWLRFLAIISYSLYLIHLVVLPPTLDLVALIPGYADGSALVRWLILAPVFSAVSIGAAVLLHLAVEKPFLLLKDRIRL